MSRLYTWLQGRTPFLVVVAVAVALAFVLARQGRPLKLAGTPSGIAGFEFAWTRARADQILTLWCGRLHAIARTQLLLDMLFLLVYPLAISLACTLLAAKPPTQMAEAGRFVALAVLVAAPLDLAENLALLAMLRSGATETLARLAAWCAGLKFTLVFAGFGYMILQGGAVLVHKAGGV